eukprot:CAMPEP_0197531786 /NCGR_PEP_ID=MMETSP1318-20131121/37117_1 /TAXON_ID=552666 /ORGANISM="Partenskyella glossopodia, Strain RCC365" /LENGTH=354 /DNA_ID=CAMNT_0043088127 /DNA_START=115 /DNA_END=1179 /DNA_ORIENTATION=-
MTKTGHNTQSLRSPSPSLSRLFSSSSSSSSSSSTSSSSPSTSSRAAITTTTTVKVCRRIALLLPLLLQLKPVIGDDIECGAMFPNGALFDLSALKEHGDYIVDDALDEPTEQYDFKYSFQICKDLDNLPNTLCKTAPNGRPGAAYQLIQPVGEGRENRNASCELLGSTAGAKWTMLNEPDGTTGVSLSYTDGDPSFCNGPRTLSIVFQCANVNTVLPTTKVAEPEGSQCHYSLLFNSVHGCPAACVSDEKMLCGGHGICGIDKTTNDTRCFCNEGYGGKFCSSAESHGSGSSSSNSGISPSAGLAAASLFLLVILLGLGAYLYVSIQRLKSEHSYGNFEQMIFEADGKSDEEYS